MNNIQILGTITREIELKYSQGGTAIVSFGIAYNSKYKKQDGSYEDKAHFFDVTAFGKRAETINMYFKKGSRILINGSLDYQSWNDKETNQKRSKVGIKLNDFVFVDRKSDAPQKQPQQYQQPPQPQQANPMPQNNMPKIDIDDDEVPF